jgi:hypothetical protein
VATNKNPDNFTSKDLLRYWSDKVSKVQSTPYVQLRWIGLDLKDLKTVLDGHDVYTVLLAIDKAVKDGTFISEFSRNFRDYDVQSPHPKLQWRVKNKGNKHHNKLWEEYQLISSRWFPSSSDRKRLLSIEEELKEWAK